ncbi:unnamed protein product [Symbiodinium necroappetens]|uniref:H-type lectin domain-containing protein n=1 Tax=Symbiodinium necroappetens TaxID=1628268 RepID=A0A813C2X9_9DINO|nr:unnamed protein product [Symbiodinium necroappetens]
MATLEVGEVTVQTGAWVSHSFSMPFAEVPVVVLAPSAQVDEPAAIRIKDVTKTGFQAVVAKPTGSSVAGASMTVSFVAVVPGVRQLPGSGLWLEAGRVSTAKLAASTKCRPSGGLSTSWQKVDFQNQFAEQPAFLTTIQTVNNEVGLPSANSEPWFTVGVNSVNPADAWVSLEMAETSQHGGSAVNQDEEVGWLAIQQGVHTFQASGQAVQCAAVKSSRSVRGWDNGPATVSFGADMGGSPLVVASQSKRFGGDGGWVRVMGTSSTSVEVVIDEDQNCDNERRHTNEEVSILAFSSGCILQ